ncbi:probable nitrogen fixation protein [Consotaella salsifontis]|uniref:Probable nitrogen fixation protein n=1 Tax=Consotaella salsifontis TaxID=1365950 RepID=A0A1T4S9U3_9HYPH|nr:probable nitrogen fixation protein [Consotaella salsifontis]
MSIVEDPNPRGGVLPDSAFLMQLVQVLRAEDSYGAWEDKSNAELLAEYVVTKEKGRDIPLMGDPEPETLWRLEKFYAAVGLRIEKETGCMAAPMMKMHHEGFGRIVLIAGRLVVLSKHLRDVHRFGFDSFARLAETGEALVAEAVGTIEIYPDAARA